MSSTKHLDLDFPEATVEEAEVLRRARELDRMSPQEYLEWCSLLTRDHPPSRDDINSPDDEPFTLP